MRSWSRFTTSGFGVVAEYIKPIIDVADPYAVLVADGAYAYRVTGAESIDDAMVIADEVLRESELADPGIRIYLLEGVWCCQVHYVGVDAQWPTHRECQRRVAWAHIEWTEKQVRHTR